MTDQDTPTQDGPALSIDVLLVIEELWDGSWITRPLADPSLASYGAPRDALAEQKTFLASYLAQVRPEVLSRFPLPEGVRLHEVEVLLPQDTLPPRVEVRAPISMACALIPAERDTWVVILPLDHTFYVSHREDLDKTIREEATRVASAQETDPLDYLRLLPPRHVELRTVTVVLDRGKGLMGGRAGSLRKRLTEKRTKDKALAILHSVARPLHKAPESRDGPPLIGQARALKLLGPLLEGSERVGTVLIGPELVGKSALIWAWMREARHKKRPLPMIFATSGAQLIAGMSGLGQWQERLRRVLEAAETMDAILYFEDLGDLFGDRAEGSVDLPGAIKPFLESGRIRLLGELTPDALDLFESRHVGFFGCLNRVRVEPLSASDTIEALRRRSAFDRDRDPDRPTLSEAAIQPLVDLVDRYLPYQAFPGKALRLYDELRATALQNRGGEVGAIDSHQIYTLFSHQSGIPLFLLREDEGLRQEAIEAAFRKRLVGQAEAVQSASRTLCVVKARLQPAGRPLATFLFVGPTGVGKTEMARTLAEFLFGSPDRLVRFDMSEFMDADAAGRLIQGSGSDEGLLTRQVRQQPFCAILLDEVEKAHPAVFDLLLQVLGEGRLTDTRGRTAHFHNTIVIMTSNLGAAHRRPHIGMGAKTAEGADAAYYKEQVAKAFRPEFVGRLDQIIAFHSLNAAQIRAVADLAIRRLKDRRGFLEAGIDLNVTETAVDALARGGASATYGARALRRHIDQHLNSPLSEILSKMGPAAHGTTVHVTFGDEDPEAAFKGAQLLSKQTHGDFTFGVYRGKGRTLRKDVRLAMSISAERRHMTDMLEWETVESIRDRIAFLVTQLSYGGGSRDKRVSTDIQRLNSEHHRLEGLMSKVEGLHADMMLIEEVAQVSLFEGDDPADFWMDSNKIWDQFNHSLTHLLFQLEPVRDRGTFLIQEPDNSRGFDQWLVPLLQNAPDRGWILDCHLQGGKTREQEEWHQDCVWGPPRETNFVLSELHKKDRPCRNILLRVRGPLAGAMLALEAGLHRWTNTSTEHDPITLQVHCVSPRIDFSEKEWLGTGIKPPAPLPAKEIGSHSAIRGWKKDALTIEVLSQKLAVNITPHTYWTHFEEVAQEHLDAYERAGVRDDLILFEERIGLPKGIE